MSVPGGPRLCDPGTELSLIEPLMFAGRHCGPVHIERHLGFIETMYMERDERLLRAGRQRMGEDRRDDCWGSGGI